MEEAAHEAAHEAEERLLLQVGAAPCCGQRWAGLRCPAGRVHSCWTCRQDCRPGRLPQSCHIKMHATTWPPAMCCACRLRAPTVLLPALSLCTGCIPRIPGLQYQQMLLEYEKAHEAESHAVEVGQPFASLFDAWRAPQSLAASLAANLRRACSFQRGTLCCRAVSRCRPSCHACRWGCVAR